MLRKTLKCFHTISACGLIGGLGCYMILLVFAPQDTPAAYADLRQSIALVSDYVLIPSLAIALVSGLLAMAFHMPFMDKGWAWAKTVMGILMFKGVLTVVGAKADHAAALAEKMEAGVVTRAAIDDALYYEWATLWIVMALSVANVVLGVWRPRFSRPTISQPRDTSAPASAPDTPSRPGWVYRNNSEATRESRSLRSVRTDADDPDRSRPHA